MRTERDVTRIVRSWMREDEHESADRVLDAVLDQLDTTPQRRSSWLARRFPIMQTNTFRVSLVAVAVLALAILGWRVLAPPDAGPPSTPPTPSQREVPDGEVPVTERLVNDGVVTTVEVSLFGDAMRVQPAQPWLLLIAETSGSLTISVADVAGAAIHRGRFAKEPLRAGTASDLLAALDEFSSLVVRDVATTTVDGRAAVRARIASERAGESAHLDVGGEGGVPLTDPNTTYLVDFEGSIILVQVSAATEAELAASQLIAQAVIASLRLSR